MTSFALGAAAPDAIANDEVGRVLKGDVSFAVAMGADPGSTIAEKWPAKRGRLLLSAAGCGLSTAPVIDAAGRLLVLNIEHSYDIKYYRLADDVHFGKCLGLPPSTKKVCGILYRKRNFAQILYYKS
jgi:hypothetical protein